MMRFSLITNFILPFQRISSVSILLLLLSYSLITGCSDQKGQQEEQKQDREGQSAAGKPPGEGGSGQPMPVTFIQIQPQQVQHTEKLPGRVVSYRMAEIRPQVSGIVQDRLFEEGTFVKEGQQLYQIDPARYQADVEMAQANLENAQARVSNAQTTVNRYDGLAQMNAISEQEFDNAKTELKQAQAAVSLADAELSTAKINLAYTKVYAPISGFISPSSITKGALVTQQQQKSLATIRQLDPAYVDLSQSVGDAQQLKARLIESRVEPSDDAQYEVSLFFSESGEPYPHKGRLDATDLAVDEQTGSIRLRSVFPNPDNLLLPGLFVRASIEGLSSSKALVVPQKSVQISEGGAKHVWVVEENDKAARRVVQTGVAYDNKWVIESGLEEGDRVIVEGTVNLREGAPVKGEPLKNKESGVNPVKNAQPESRE